MTRVDGATVRYNVHGQPIGAEVPGWSGARRPGRVEMDGQWCRVIPLDPSHGDDLFAAFSEDESGALWTYMPVGPFETRAAFDAWLAWAAGSADPLFFAIMDRASGRAAGVASFLRIDLAMGTIEVGYIAFSPRLQRTALATEAMYLMMAQVFTTWGNRRYEWKCDDLNAPSRRAALRLGFTYEGTFRQAMVYKGRNRDTAWYAITDRAWPSREAAFKAWLDASNFDAEGRQLRHLGEFMPDT